MKNMKNFLTKSNISLILNSLNLLLFIIAISFIFSLSSKVDRSTATGNTQDEEDIEGKIESVQSEISEDIEDEIGFLQNDIDRINRKIDAQKTKTIDPKAPPDYCNDIKTNFSEPKGIIEDFKAGKYTSKDYGFTIQIPDKLKHAKINIITNKDDSFVGKERSAIVHILTATTDYEWDSTTLIDKIFYYDIYSFTIYTKKQYTDSCNSEDCLNQNKNDYAYLPCHHCFNKLGENNKYVFAGLDSGNSTPCDYHNYLEQNKEEDIAYIENNFKVFNIR
ncbi:MAG: hypothetical protein GF347_00985 [Candidatus Moranbacteria bacterium]|nr:hypothetical protein [Candidatus Moranbacteria bacterium]